MPTVTAGDLVKLYAEAHGEGFPLLLSPGYCQTHENFRPQVEPLVAAGARVVLWDYRGHGKSESPENPGAYLLERVLDDIQAMEERHGIHHVHFSDEAVPPKVILQLADFIVERRLPTRWGGYARFERTFTPEFCARIAKGGCSVLFMGLEAAAPRVSRLMNKGVDPSLAHRILKSLQEAGVQVHLCTVIGFPGETREEARETFDFLMENRHLYESYSCMPFVLEKNSAVARNPERFGVTRLVDDIHDDLRPHYWYEVATGLSMEETGSLYQEFNERLAAAGAYNPIFV